METTLIILKPDAVQRGLMGRIITRFEDKGLQIVGCKLMQISQDLAAQHYKDHASKPFYPEIEAFMSSRPVIVLALRGENVVAVVRDLLGPTDSRKAPKGTIRGDYGTEMMKNVVHASDSEENGLIEIARFFHADEVYA